MNSALTDLILGLSKKERLRKLVEGSWRNMIEKNPIIEELVKELFESLSGGIDEVKTEIPTEDRKEAVEVKERIEKRFRSKCSYLLTESKTLGEDHAYFKTLYTLIVNKKPSGSELL